MLTKLKFSKMHGLGNDFIVINGIENPLNLEALPIVSLAHRHTGIGFDQLLYVSTSSVADFSCRIFNSDGTEAEQCGNGLRCAVRFIHEEKLSFKKNLTIELKKNSITAQLIDFNHIQIGMGIPELAPPCEIFLDNKTFTLDVLSLGNPHAILSVNSIEQFPVTEVGPKISTHAMFPHGVNVGFMQIINPEHILLRTYERGAGETLACGSNSCAAVVSGIQNKQLQHKVKVDLAMGSLWIEWAGGKNIVKMTGPAAKVFEGLFDLSNAFE